MITFPNCKINLGLNVVRRREDGFHDIETVFYPVPPRDALEILPAADGLFEFSTSGTEIPGDPGQNLCVKAFRLLQSEYSIPAVKMHLHKVIPTGSGLGGGSADGAFALAMLNELFGLEISTGKLIHFAGSLGSDCAFFIENRPCFATGKGDRLEPVTVDLRGWYFALVIPGVHVSTPEAYRLVTPAQPARPVSEIITLPVGEWKELLVNDFEKSVSEKFPVIGQVKQQLYAMGAVYASMSGSGSAVFGLFEACPDLGGFGECSTWAVRL
jgi:4-diphosphocytidyl-2-C-methyl-D-erythritol kinase